MIESGKIVGLYGLKLHPADPEASLFDVLVATFDNREDAFKYAGEVTLRRDRYSGLEEFHRDSVLAGFNGFAIKTGPRVIHNPKA